MSYNNFILWCRSWRCWEVSEVGVDAWIDIGEPNDTNLASDTDNAELGTEGQRVEECVPPREQP